MTDCIKLISESINKAGRSTIVNNIRAFEPINIRNVFLKFKIIPPFYSEKMNIIL
jgi:hypothetical protein